MNKQLSNKACAETVCTVCVEQAHLGRC